MAKTKTRTKKTRKTKGTEQLRKEAISSIDEILAGDGKSKRGSN